MRDTTAAHGPLYGLVNNAALGYDGVLATMHDSQIEDYTSHNTQQPTVAEVVKVVGALPEVQEELGKWLATHAHSRASDVVKARSV